MKILKGLFLILMSLLPVAVQAQHPAGEWFTYPVYEGTVSNLIETPSGKLYFQAGSNLYSYDTKSNELYSYTKRNLLNDNSISFIRYNYDRNYLAAVYDNCNIDLIFDNGNVVNLSDIKDAVMMADKLVNDVAFDGDRMYVATSFGLVVFDTKKKCVVESGIYGMPIYAVNVVSGHIVVFARIEEGGRLRGYLFSSPVEKSHFAFDSFDKFTTSELSVSGNRIYVIPGEENYIYTVNNSDTSANWNCAFRRYNLNFDQHTFGYKAIKNPDNPTETEKLWNHPYPIVFLDKENYLNLAYPEAQAIYRVKESEFKEKKTLPSEIAGGLVTSYDGAKKVWVSKDSKIGFYDITGSAANVLVSPFVPQGACNIQKVGHFTASHSGRRVYVNPIGPAHLINVNIGSDGKIDYDGTCVRGTVNIIEGGVITDASAYNVTQNCCKRTTWSQDKYGHKMIVSPSGLAEAYNDSTTYYMASYTDGVYKIKNGEVVGKYDVNNSPMVAVVNSLNATSYGGVNVSSVGVDNNGNLWVASGTQDAKATEFLMLPYAKTLLPTESVTASDWIVYPHGTSNFRRDVRFLAPKHNPNIVMFLVGVYSTELFICDTKGTPSSSDDEYIIYSSFTDQDGKDFSLVGCVTLVEDKDGNVWLAGNSTGVLQLSDICDASGNLNPNITATRLKVPRNDGTSYADYLLDTENISCISVDPSNRKWVSTYNSGLYLVSADGKEVLEHLTAENSHLPDNKVIEVYADPFSNRIYAGTVYGLTTYNSTSAPASDDFNNVYAFPNPVRPEYTGWITIDGLMDNSLVKIVNTQGQVLYQGRSEGGMMMWDGCDKAGNRVKSGVYYVYASAGNADASSGKVATKILVVN